MKRLPGTSPRILLLVLIGFTLGRTSVAVADVTLPSLFSDHMVLQRGIPVPVWGRANPGEKVTVTFAGKNVSTQAGADGKWSVKLGPFEATTAPAILTAAGASGTPERKVADVLVGEVWVGAGQSNMQIPASGFLPSLKSSDKELSKSPGDLNLKALVEGGPYPMVRLFTAVTDPKNPNPAVWQLSTPENLAQFSAQLQCFGVNLQRKLNVPVGLLVSAVGGSPSGRWVSASAMAQDPGCQQAIARANETFSMEKAQANYEAALKKYEADKAAWDQLTDEQKKTAKAPGKPGVPVRPGEGSRWPVGDLHDQVLSQIVGFGIRGILWDQGESGSMVSSVDQNTMMNALFRSWRSEWNIGEFPFICVEKPSGGGCAFDYSDKIYGWASDPFEGLPATVPGDGAGREQFQKLAENPNVHLSPTSDLGSGLHPWNKFGYGIRAMRVALGAVYGKKEEYTGPMFAGQQVEGGKIRVTFTHVGKGLTFRNGEKLQGFAIAAQDKKFVWADAVIDGGAVVVSNPAISAPAFVRYAWSGKHPWANLFNADGFPAFPFRTDR